MGSHLLVLAECGLLNAGEFAVSAVTVHPSPLQFPDSQAFNPESAMTSVTFLS
jgi:hypothetical protein